MVKALVLLFASMPCFAVELKMPPRVQQGEVDECELDASRKPTEAKVRAPDTEAKGKLILGGGGYDTGFYRDPFVKHVFKNIQPDDVVPIIASAALNEASANGSYLAWNKKFEGKIPLRPIYTTNTDHKKVTLGTPTSSPTRSVYKETRMGRFMAVLVTEEVPNENEPAPPAIKSIEVSTDPNEEANFMAIRNAKTAIIIDGGMVGNLEHLAGTKVAAELQAAYRRGVTIWASSEGTNAVGAVNASLLWPKDIKRSEEQKAKGMKDKYQEPSFVGGIAVTSDFGVSSHVDGPRLPTVFGYGEKKTIKEGNKTTESFTSKNFYAFLDPMRQLAPSLDYPMFGVPDEAVMHYHKGIASFDGSDAESRFYVFDPRYPPTQDCDYFYVKTGAKYDLRTGVVTPPPAGGVSGVTLPKGH